LQPKKEAQVSVPPASSPRRVCLVGLIAGGHSGVPRYAARLARALDAECGLYPQLSLSLLTTAAGAEAVAPRSLDVTIVGGRGRHVNAGPGRLLLEQVAALRARADLLHYFDVTGPVLAPKTAFVATIHDTAFMRGLARARDGYKRRLYPWALRRAAALVAVSQFAKDEAVEHFGSDPAKISVVHSGPGLFSEIEWSSSSAGGLVGGHLLYVGNLGANKNLPFLVRAFERADVPARLVLVGRVRGSSTELEQAIRSGPHGDRIDVRLDVQDAELIHLYRSALALLLPSTYEGFGFPALEAMASGCPVLESDIPGLREVSGPGAMLLPADDVEAWAEAIRRIVADDALRSELRRCGAETVARYSWTRTARQVLAVLAATPVVSAGPRARRQV
jgi:glycosyltransferase involved in cell wall biosynthesis